MGDTVVAVDGVSFRYFRRTIFESLSVTVGRGITGLLGPNGAGKSTLLSLLSTRRSPRTGTLDILGYNAGRRADREQIRRRLGYLAQRYPLVGSMKVLDTVIYAAWASGLGRRRCEVAANEAIERAEIADLALRRVRTLSGGQRQRVGVAAAIVHRPDLLLLDEPTAGLDPEVRMVMRRTLKQIAEQTAVVISTHLIEDVLALCDDVIVLDGGQVLFEGDTAELQRHATEAALAGDDARVAGSAMERGYAALLAASRGHEK